jgi:hypothetical protein
MTERQRDERFLADLLQTPDTPVEQAAGQPAGVDQSEPLYEHVLTRQAERALLREANEVGTPTLAPQELGTATSEQRGSSPVMPGSLVSELLDVVRRHPIPALLGGAGLAYVLTRRRR